VWMVAKELVPEAREDLSARMVAGVVALSTIAMIVFQVLVLA
jgi:hypothetical protein